MVGWSIGRADEIVPEAPVQYVVCGYDGEEDACFTAIVNIVTLADMANANAICSAYAVDVDGLYEIDWQWSEDGFIFYVYDCHGCEVEYVDLLPQVH